MLIEIFSTFLKLGLFAFGGPAAHIAMMENEFVHDKGWLSQEEFLSLLGFTNLIPGPNSTEMAMLIGQKRAGKKGLLVAGFAFILPAMILVMFIGFLYQRYHELDQIQTIFNTMQPVVMAIILSALVKMLSSQIKDINKVVIFILALIAAWFKMNELLVLLSAGLLYYLSTKIKKDNLFVIEPLSLMSLFFIFFKIGLILFGSGYVLFAFVQAEFVNSLGLLSNSQIVDAILVGEITPGPVLTTATFIGYQFHGILGGLIATLGIFLPSFLLVLLLGSIFERLQSIKWFSTILSGVAMGSLALMAMVLVNIGMTSLTSGLSIAIFVITSIGLIKYKKSPFLFICLTLVLSLFLI